MLNQNVDSLYSCSKIRGHCDLLTFHCLDQTRIKADIDRILALFTPENMSIESKDRGAKKVTGMDLGANELVAKLLVQSGLKSQLIESLGQNIFFKNVMLLETIGPTPQLHLHRDRYHSFGKQVGPTVPVYKLVILLEASCNNNSLTRVIPYLKNQDFNNRWIDYIIGKCLTIFAVTAPNEKYSAFLFNGRYPHYRPKLDIGMRRVAIVSIFAPDNNLDYPEQSELNILVKGNS